jgi:hydroxyacylglutathione hydrolase
VKALLEGQPDAPVYFSRMKRMNRAGPPLLGDRGTPKRLDPDRLGGVGDSLILIDTRARDAYERDAVKGALHLPAGKTFVTYASYVIDPEKDKCDIVLLARDEAQAASLRDRLSYVGIDNVAGFVTDFGNLERVQVNTVAPDALSELDDPFILDIRTKGEYEAGHLPKAQRIHAGRVMWDLGELPRIAPW